MFEWRRLFPPINGINNRWLIIYKRAPYGDRWDGATKEFYGFLRPFSRFTVLWLVSDCAVYRMNCLIFPGEKAFYQADRPSS